MLELFLRFTGETNHEGRADCEIRTDLAPLADPLKRLLGVRRTGHTAKHIGVRVLKRNIEVREDLPFRHQRNNAIHHRVRVHVVEADPETETAELDAEVFKTGMHGAAARERELIAEVRTVGRCVLRDHHDFLHAVFLQAPGFTHDGVHRAGVKLAAELRNDAERAVIVAAFGNLKVRVVLRGQTDTAARNEIEVRRVRSRKVLMHELHHILLFLRSQNAEHRGVPLHHEIRPVRVLLPAEASHHDHAAVFTGRFGDRAEALLNRLVDEPAGIHDHEIRIPVVIDDRIAFAPELRNDALGVDKRLGAAKGHKTDRRNPTGRFVQHGRRFPFDFSL
ncbi:putative membrane-associated oxidoreductase [Sutterella sp. CAG:351]|nr:putative membrane-associated oxidoreductase [Sutterella sp. CAG:351]